MEFASEHRSPFTDRPLAARECPLPHRKAPTLPLMGRRLMETIVVFMPAVLNRARCHREATAAATKPQAQSTEWRRSFAVARATITITIRLASCRRLACRRSARSPTPMPPARSWLVGGTRRPRRRSRHWFWELSSSSSQLNSSSQLSNNNNSSNMRLSSSRSLSLRRRPTLPTTRLPMAATVVVVLVLMHPPLPPTR